MQSQVWVFLGAVLGAVAVAAGAFAAHGLKHVLEPDRLESFMTAAHYQLLHAVLLVVIGLLIAQWPGTAAQAAAWLVLAGIVLFSGGIYAWQFTGIRGLVHVVPVGGVCLILGWVLLAVAAIGRSGAGQ